jgi:hypothetical protein
MVGLCLRQIEHKVRVSEARRPRTIHRSEPERISFVFGRRVPPRSRQLVRNPCWGKHGLLGNHAKSIAQYNKGFNKKIVDVSACDRTANPTMATLFLANRMGAIVGSAATSFRIRHYPPRPRY